MIMNEHVAFLLKLTVFMNLELIPCYIHISEGGFARVSDKKDRDVVVQVPTQYFMFVMIK